MKPNYTHITLVSDRSGSMNSVRADAEGGINSYIKDQAEAPGECTLTLFQFDSGHSGDDHWFDKVYEGAIAFAPQYTLMPRGGTALNDAVFRAITQTGELLTAMPEDQRPERVLFVVMTDGEENSSREVSLEDVKAAVKRQTEEFNWEFVFLGAGLEVAKQAMAMGVAASNITNFDPNSGVAMAAAWDSTSRSTANYRTKGVANYASNVRKDGTVEHDDERTDVKQ